MTNAQFLDLLLAGRMVSHYSLASNGTGDTLTFYFHGGARLDVRGPLGLEIRGTGKIEVENDSGYLEYREEMRAFPGHLADIVTKPTSRED